MAGCGPSGPKNSISGKVTLKSSGQPVSGMISLIGSDGQEKPVPPAPIGPDGSYTIAEPTVGTNKVVIKGFPGMGAPVAAPKLPGAPDAPAMGAPPPAKYGSANTPLTVEVKGGRQTGVDFPLDP